MPYRPLFSDTAVEFVTTLPRRRQRRLVTRAQELARDPFLTPDFIWRDEDGRDISHLLVDGFLFSYWVDHAVKVVMIVDIEDGE
ncbi:MAG TPA: hypothetical protein VMM36_14500 [Opitutaceae bacterium]|nr:hypothetical protein [Opitutaceae bacterium]